MVGPIYVLMTYFREKLSIVFEFVEEYDFQDLEDTRNQLHLTIYAFYQSNWYIYY